MCPMEERAARISDTESDTDEDGVFFPAACPAAAICAADLSTSSSASGISKRPVVFHVSGKWSTELQVEAFVKDYLERGEVDDIMFVSEVRDVGFQVCGKRLSSKFVVAAISKVYGVSCFKPSKMLGSKIIQRKGFRQLRFRRAVPAVSEPPTAARGRYDSVNLTMHVFQREILSTIHHSLTLEIPQKIIFYGGSPGDHADCLAYLRSKHVAHSVKAKNWYSNGVAEMYAKSQVQRNLVVLECQDNETVIGSGLCEGHSLATCLLSGHFWIPETFRIAIFPAPQHIFVFSTTFPSNLAGWEGWKVYPMANTQEADE